MKKIRLLFILLLFPFISYGAINLEGIYDVKFSGGTATASFTEELPNILMIGRGNYVQLNTTLPLETNIVNESDLVFALDRFNYDQSDIYTVAGQNTEYSYELSFIKWNTGNPRLRLVDVNVSPIPEFSSFTLLLGIFSSFLMFFRKKY